MKTRILPLIVLLLGAQLAAVAATAPSSSEVKLTRLKDRVRVEIGGQLFTEYVHGDDASRSYCWPILAIDGMPLTRDFPMKKTEGEETDHPWQKSFWFAHSSVNGIDFWNEAGGDLGRSSQFKGHTRVDGEVQTSTSAGKGTIKVRDRWLAPDGALIATDDRVISFHADADGRFIDFEITVHALPDKALLMGDNKDGTMATRVAQWMTMPHKVAGKEAGGNGHIVTAKGDRDDAAWGKRADWCDYNAEHNGKIYGIAIFDHPKNLQHPTWWMARNYGLFGANPFGWHDYEPAFKDDPHKGDYTIPAGGSLTLRYRFYFHIGDEKSAALAERYADYAAGK